MVVPKTPQKGQKTTPTRLVFTQWTRRWFMDSSLTWHKKHLFAKDHPRFWTWSYVSQAKKLTLGCTHAFHMLLQGKEIDVPGSKSLLYFIQMFRVHVASLMFRSLGTLLVLFMIVLKSLGYFYLKKGLICLMYWNLFIKK